MIALADLVIQVFITDKEVDQCTSFVKVVQMVKLKLVIAGMSFPSDVQRLTVYREPGGYLYVVRKPRNFI